LKFRNRIKWIKRLKKLQVKLRDLLFKKPFYKYLYHLIKDEFTNNNKTAIRYYLDANTLRDESFKFEIELYHKAYYTSFDLRYLEQIFMFTKDYIEHKISKYSDLQFIYGEDELGLYFEVSYIDDY